LDEDNALDLMHGILNLQQWMEAAHNQEIEMM
jgi:hypothetical protein